MAWKKILTENDIGDEIPGHGHSHEIGLQPEDFNVGPLGFQYDGTEYSRATVITPLALQNADEAMSGGEILTLTDETTWSKARAMTVGGAASSLLGVYVGADGPYVKMVLEGFVALPSSSIDPVNETSIQGGELMYLSSVAGTITSVPSVSAGRIVRTIGYCITYTQGTGGIFWFKPENLWLEVAIP